MTTESAKPAAGPINKLAVWYAAVIPGILVAATGVGAGDLLTASFAGSKIGLMVLWAALAGAVLKWSINEGVARWQLATETTLLEGWVGRLGRWVGWVFLGYLLIWSFAVGGALVTACGVAGTGLFPIGGGLAGRMGFPADPATTSKILWGVLHSAFGLALVWIGGFRLFEKLMAFCIAVMFVTVMLTAVMLPRTDWGAVALGAVNPLPALANPDALIWILGVLGGVGGTVTVLSYGYWIREAGRSGQRGVRACRLDLAIGYGMTALFGMAMVLIGSRVSLEKGELMAIDLAKQLRGVLGPAGFWIFLVGFWGAVFSSLLGVWQSVPYLFADFRAIQQGKPAATRERDLSKTRPYRVYLIAIAVVPLPLLWGKVTEVQLTYAILGALFMPLLALTLLIMNNRTGWVGKPFRSGWVLNAILLLTVLAFVVVGIKQGYDAITKPRKTQDKKPPIVQPLKPAIGQPL